MSLLTCQLNFASKHTHTHTHFILIHPPIAPIRRDHHHAPPPSPTNDSETTEMPIHPSACSSIRFWHGFVSPLWLNVARVQADTQAAGISDILAGNRVRI